VLQAQARHPLSSTLQSKSWLLERVWNHVRPKTNPSKCNGLTAEPGTVRVGIHQCLLPNGQKIFLVDTPGFDDTYRSDTQVLSEVADWLNQAYSHKILLSGIIYLHRILDVRMGGAAMKNLRMFKKLCGDDGLGSVVLATTFWGNVSPQEGTTRESQLKNRPDFWKSMIDRGSTVLRQDRGATSAREIVQYLIQKRRPRALEIQKDMVDHHKTLDQTAAGQEVQAELARQRVEYENRMKEIRREMRQAMEKKDREHQEELRIYRAEMDEKIRRFEEDKKLIVSSQSELRAQIAEDLWERFRPRSRCVMM
jgi:hypothetical protein